MFSNTTRAAAPRLTQQLLAASVLAIASVAAIASPARPKASAAPMKARRVGWRRNDGCGKFVSPK